MTLEQYTDHVIKSTLLYIKAIEASPDIWPFIKKAMLNQIAAIDELIEVYNMENTKK